MQKDTIKFTATQTLVEGKPVTAHRETLATALKMKLFGKAD